jgi:hypothetical protein
MHCNITPAVAVLQSLIPCPVGGLEFQGGTRKATGNIEKRSPHPRPQLDRFAINQERAVSVVVNGSQSRPGNR